MTALVNSKYLSAPWGLIFFQRPTFGSLMRSKICTSRDWLGEAAYFKSCLAAPFSSKSATASLFFNSNCLTPCICLGRCCEERGSTFKKLLLPSAMLTKAFKGLCSNPNSLGAAPVPPKVAHLCEQSDNSLNPNILLVHSLNVNLIHQRASLNSNSSLWDKRLNLALPRKNHNTVP